MAEILRVNTDTENGVESRLVKTPVGLVVGIFDVDENEAMSDLYRFAFDEDEAANALFDRISN